MSRKLIFAILILAAIPALAAVTVTVNGSNHTIPQTNEKGWGANVTAWIQAISQYTLQPSGGTFTLTADTDFGANYGLKSTYFKSRAANLSTAGIFRMGNNESIGWRNAANSGNILLRVNTSDQLEFNGSPLLAGGLGLIVDADISASANIADSKLATISTAGKVQNSATTATSSNTASAIVTRDASGNFTAGTITAALSGNASTASAFDHSPLGCSSNTFANGIGANGDLVCSSVANAATTATSTNTNSAIVARDGSGNFSAGTITANLTGSVTGNASTATALAANPSDCSAGQYATTIAASGNLTCAQVATSQLSGNINLGTQVTGTLGATNGGTGQSTWTTGDIPYASATNTVSKLGIGSSGQVMKVVGGVPTWATFSGGINYVSSNPDAESDTTGWTTYDDGAATPVDLTAGAFGGTFARSTSSPLRGAGSFLYTPGTTGEGVAFTITPERADYGNVLECGFDAEYVTATAAEGAYQLWVYDVANSSLIQPAGYKLPGGVAGLEFKYKATFQLPTNATTVRVAIHQAASTSAALKFDNVYCGPQVKSYGPFISDPVSYTPSTTGFGSPTIAYANWHRAGKFIYVKFAFSTGTSTAAGASIGLPSGLSLDTSGESGSVVEGYWSATGTPFSGAMTAVTGSSTTAVYFSNGGASYSSVLSGNAWANGTTISGWFKAPIAGWSSGQLLSSDAGDSRAVALQVYGQPTGTVASTLGSSTTAVYPSKTSDTHASYSSGTYTVPVAGHYRITAQVYITGTVSAGKYFTAGIYRNGSLAHYSQTQAGGASSWPAASINATIYCNAGDTLTTRFASDITSPTFAGDNNNNFLHIERISTGNQQVAASETVVAKYVNTAGTSITSTPATVPFATKVYDSHGAFNGATGVFTAPAPGKYEFTVQFYTTTVTNTTGQALQMNWLVTSTPEGLSGAQEYGPPIWGTGASQAVGLQATKTYQLNAGDTVAVQLSNANTVNLITTSGRNWVTIKRVGN